MASRRKGRILAFQALYSWDANHVSVDELINFSWYEDEKKKPLDENTKIFSRILIAGTIENIKEIDELIQNHLANWVISRLKRVDLAVLRISVFTLVYQIDIAPSIVIDEAVGLCREYGTDDSYKFVNGVLDSIKNSILMQRQAEN